MDEVFGIVPDLPTPYLKRRPAPASAQPVTSSVDTTTRKATDTTSTGTNVATSFVSRWIDRLFGDLTPKNKEEPPQVNTFLSLKQGDKTITLAIVDGGNVGWTRLGRGGFEEHSMVPYGW
jgi:tRNA-splicing endonuclease subunit Sen54